MYSKIYWVDDNELVNLTHQVFMRKLEVDDKVRAFTDPEEALDEIRFDKSASNPILVLLDICMPVMNGFEFLELMESGNIPTSVDIVIFTSSVSPKDKDQAAHYPQYV